MSYIDQIAGRVADRLDAFNRAVDPLAGAATEPALQAEVDALLAPALAHRLDEARRSFAADDEYVAVEDGLPMAVVERIRREINRGQATRSVVPWYRSAGSIGYRRIQREAPFTAAFYRSRALVDYVSALCGKTVACKPDHDDHACTFYVYDRPGDRMVHHYDTCGCEDGASYSLIIGIIDDSTQRLLVDLHRGDRTRTRRSLRLATRPGTVVTFAGSKLWHGVSRLGRNEVRVTLGLAYQTSHVRPPRRRLVNAVADTFFHFGVGGALKRWRRSSVEGG
jgi:hypothetical protein